MKIPRSCWVAMAAAALLLIAAPMASADPITDALALGTGLSLNWSSSADSLTVPVGASNGSPLLASWDVTFELDPVPGNSSGTLGFDNANIALPANDALTHNPQLVTNSTVTDPISGLSTQVFVQALNVSFGQGDNDLVPASGKNLAQLKFLSSGASGDFVLRAINNNVDSKWTDGNAHPNAFSNAAAGQSFDLGTIHVLAAVPEPASMILGTISALGIAGCSWRQRRRRSNAGEHQVFS